MVHTKQDIREIVIEKVSVMEPEGDTSQAPATASQSDYAHPDPRRQEQLASVFDETWPSMEVSIHYLRDK